VTVFDETTLSTIATCRATCSAPATPAGSTPLTGRDASVFAACPARAPAPPTNCTVTAGPARRASPPRSTESAPVKVYSKLLDDGPVMTAA